MLAAIMATIGERSPSADISSTETTNALEIGFQSEIPVEMPLTNTNRNDQRAARTARSRAAAPSSSVATSTSADTPDDDPGERAARC